MAAPHPPGGFFFWSPPLANKRVAALTQNTSPTETLSYLADGGTGEAVRVIGGDLVKKTPFGTATTPTQNLNSRIDFEKQFYWYRKVTGSTYTLAVSGTTNDLGEEVRFTAACTITVPQLTAIPNISGTYAPGADNLRTGWIAGIKILLTQFGTGALTLSLASGVTAVTGSVTSTNAQYQSLDLEYLSATSVRVVRISGASA